MNLANVAIAKKPNDQGSSSKNTRTSTGMNIQNQFFNGRDNGGRRGRGRGKPPNFRSICQICHTTGHEAMKCCYRFDQTYQASNNNQIGQGFVGNMTQ